MKKMIPVLVATIFLVALVWDFQTRHPTAPSSIEGLKVPPWHRIVQAKYHEEPRTHWESEGPIQVFGIGWNYSQSAVMLTDLSTEQYCMWVQKDGDTEFFVDLDSCIIPPQQFP